MVMKNGEKINCPHCGEKSFVREKKCFDDAFVLKKVLFVCALCGKPLEDKAPNRSGVSGKNNAADRLSALLGGEKVQKISFAPDASDGRFCLHCVNYIKHPFMNRCGVTLKEIQATDSCELFEAKSAVPDRE